MRGILTERDRMSTRGRSGRQKDFFASLAQSIYLSRILTMIIAALAPQTKKFTDPP